MSNLNSKIVEFQADIPTLWKLQCKNLYNSKNLAALAVRECVQNSLDSIQEAIKIGKIKQGKIDISWNEDEDYLTITDNGMGMDIDTLHNKFLTLGGTTKGDSDNTGGFGLAKSVILGCGTGFNIHTQDNQFSSTDIGVNPIHKTTYLQGTEIKLYKPQVNLTHTLVYAAYELEDAVKDYIFSSIIPKNTKITLNGETCPYKFRPTVKSRRIPAELGISNDMIPADTTLDINVFKTKNALHYLYVRLRGLTQFKMYLSWNANCDITLDFQTTLDPRSSEYPFSTNREGLKAHYQGIVEAIRDKVSQSPTSVAKDDRYKETIYDNVESPKNVAAARNLVTTLTTKQVEDTVKGLEPVITAIKNSGGFSPQGGYTPVTVMDYVAQTAQVINQAATQCNATKAQIIESIQPTTLFKLNNPLSHSWIVYEDTRWKNHKRINQSSLVSLVIVWDSILKLMASTIADRFDTKEFYPGVILEENVMGMCLEKMVYPKNKSMETRYYVMVNPLEMPKGSPTKLALWLMGVAAHELAHLICGSYEAHGESHSYTREAIMNFNLDNVDNIVGIVKSSKIQRTLGNSISTSTKSPYKDMDIAELANLADSKGIDITALQNKYPDPRIFRMRLIMALKKIT